MPVIGFLDSRSPDTMAGRLRAFREGLKEAGYVEDENVAIEYRWAEGHNDRLPALAVGLVRRQVKVLVASAGTPSALAAKTATASLPIIFITGNDPVKLGLVASLNRPGGNIAGVTVISLEVTGIELLREMIPTAAIVALLVNPTSSYSEPEIREAQEASRTLGLRLHVLEASSERDIDAAFASLLELRASALLVSADPFFSSRRHQLVALAARYASPAIYAYRDFAEGGGLMSYGANIADAYRQAGTYVGRVLKGEKPADLPVLQPTKFELVINLKTAKALGLTVPLALQAIADVIE
jgi:putative tryptophan/tyrosine transport system substrate-binding protein